MNVKVSEMKRYLLKEQGYEDKEVNNMSIEDLYDLYTMYQED